MQDNPAHRVKTSVIVSLYEELHSLSLVAARVGLCRTSVYWRLVRVGVDTSRKLKEIGCERCVTEPYAHGLCHSCWTLKRRRAAKAKALLEGPIGFGGGD